MKSKIVPVIFLLLIFPILSGFALYHRYGPFMGKVIDAETKEPIEGAAVLAVYYTVSAGLGGGGDNYTNAQETVTDNNGEFYIPPLNDFTLRPLQHHAKYVSFTIFKPGYVPFNSHPGHYQNRVLINGSSPPNSYLSSGEKHIIQLPKLTTIKERLHSLIIRPVNRVPKNKYNDLLRLINEESRNLGVDEIPIDEK